MQTIPYVALVVAFALIYLPRLFVAQAQAKQTEGYDNALPRAQQARLTGLGARAQGAHMNGFEAFAPFAAGVLACELRHVPIERTAILCAVFMIARTVYIGLYLGNVPTARSAIWSVGFLASLGLLVSATLGG